MAQVNFMTWNTNGLKERVPELTACLIFNNIHICLISETHDTKESKHKIQNYEYYNTIHPSNNARGGSGILIKSDIQHEEFIKIQTNSTQVTAIRVQFKTKMITVAAIYNPPRHYLKTEEYVSLFNTLDYSFIIGGDWNAKHTNFGSRVSTAKGRELYHAILDTNSQVLSTGNPTFYSSNQSIKPDLLDFFVVKNISINYLTINECDELSSDHSPIILTLSERVILKDNQFSLTNRRTNWDLFRIELANLININPVDPTKESIDYEVTQLTSLIQSTLIENTPTYSRNTNIGNYPPEIVDLIKQKRKARNKWKNTRDPSYKKTWNFLTNLVKHEISDFQSNSFQSHLNKLTYSKDTDYSLWKTTRRIKRPITKQPPLKAEGSWIRNNQEKANIFADYLEEVFTGNPSCGNDASLEELPPYMPDETFQPISLHQLQKYIQLLGNHKAPGFDYITAEILKQLPRKAMVMLRKIINACLEIRYFPKMWKIAQVIMIPKLKGDSSDCASYRPISLLPVMSKLFEKIILKQLDPYISKIIPNHQFGFRNKHSTIDQVHRIVDIINKALEDGNVCSAIFFDVSKAFDKVWHEGLIFKMRKLLPVHFAELLESYLSGRSFRIKQDNSFSELKEIKAGVPQGSVLGPILYLLFTADLPDLKSNVTATFADDTAFLAIGRNEHESTSRVASSVSLFSDWTKKWRIKLNEAKSSHVNFTNRRINYIPVRINDKIIPHCNEAKYLGITLDAKLRWKAHVKKKCEEIALKLRSLYWLIGRRSSLPTECKLMIYRQVLKPIWTYGCQLWGCAAASHRLKIQQQQNKILRLILNVPRCYKLEYLHDELEIPLVDEEIRNQAVKHAQRLSEHVNQEASQLLDRKVPVKRLRRVNPLELSLL